MDAQAPATLDLNSHRAWKLPSGREWHGSPRHGYAQEALSGFPGSAPPPPPNLAIVEKGKGREGEKVGYRAKRPKKCHCHLPNSFIV
ncbi:hypothetical protein CSOJ01_00434 [Colletotrichum sojae]|uniref:Uncharacterized protein n=1 Tax=Colletotrichum sojae TaxID=2175907 RepID=A0A8H6N5K0_9PEZI|nr:hypothetical protein CSOJ01_00434 [Colletotrichum sojae]